LFLTVSLKDAMIGSSRMQSLKFSLVHGMTGKSISMRVYTG